MARVDFFAIQERIQFVLKNDPDLKDVEVAVESEPPENIEQTPWVGIYLERWEDDGGIIETFCLDAVIEDCMRTRREPGGLSGFRGVFHS